MEKGISYLHGKKARLAMLTSDKIDLGSKKVTKDREGYYMMQKCPSNKDTQVHISSGLSYTVKHSPV